MFGQRKECPKFSLYLKINNTNPHYVWVYLLYCCESAFSKMNFIKNELRICMTNENIHHCLRVVSLPWKQIWSSWQEVENAIYITNRKTNNGDNFC